MFSRTQGACSTLMSESLSKSLECMIQDCPFILNILNQENEEYCMQSGSETACATKLKSVLTQLENLILLVSQKFDWRLSQLISHSRKSVRVF